MFRNNLYLKVLIHYELVRGGQVVKADAFIRPQKKKKKIPLQEPKIAQKCNDRFRKHPLHQQLNKEKALKSQSEVT